MLADYKTAYDYQMKQKIARAEKDVDNKNTFKMLHAPKKNKVNNL